LLVELATVNSLPTVSAESPFAVVAVIVSPDREKVRGPKSASLMVSVFSGLVGSA